MANRYDTEAREEQIRLNTIVFETRLTAAFHAGQKPVTKLILDRLGDYLADDQALAELAREALGGINGLQGVVQNVIFSEAEDMAEKEVQRMERNRDEASAESRYSAAMYDRALA